jgi:hypothetical protein
MLKFSSHAAPICSGAEPIRVSTPAGSVLSGGADDSAVRCLKKHSKMRACRQRLLEPKRLPCPLTDGLDRAHNVRFLKPPPAVLAASDGRAVVRIKSDEQNRARAGARADLDHQVLTPALEVQRRSHDLPGLSPPDGSLRLVAVGSDKLCVPSTTICGV